MRMNERQVVLGPAAAASFKLTAAAVVRLIDPSMHHTLELLLPLFRRSIDLRGAALGISKVLHVVDEEVSNCHRPLTLFGPQGNFWSSHFGFD
ncbi:hypothetical protein R1flu_019150 [Riccia fluitans]|uniref:Uncharacterized protein n=1 Tax=Riccia fluitans TaxID=41844 RepID=A0ABD1ZIW4_9MARC